MSSKKASSEATQPIDESSSENAAASSKNEVRTVEASNHFGQIAFGATCEVPASLYAILANEGFEGRLVSAASKLDAHAQFGHFGHKGPDGKPVKRSENYKRGEAKFTPERGELVRQTLATGTFPELVVSVTTGRYESSAVKAVTVDQAGLIVAKNAIVKRGDNPTELDKLAKMVSFSYSATSELTVENPAFVDSVASFYANL